MIPKSSEIRVEVTTRCNYRCVICPREQLTRPIETMSLKLFSELFDRINSETDQYKILTFPGMGEPLLDKTLESKIEYARKKAYTIMLLTNGSLLDADRFKKLESLGVESVRVSMYGFDRKSYAGIHGVKGDFFDVVKNNLMEICEIKKRTKILLTYNVVPGINDSHLDSWIAFWEKRVDLIEVWKPHNWVTGRSYRGVQARMLKSCGRPWNTPLQVQVDGTINMCCFDFNGSLLLGDLKKSSLKEIFEGDEFNKILRCHSTGRFKNSGLICEHCDQRNRQKMDIMVHNSKFEIKKRVRQVSTTYRDVYR